jgi:hypothetical protein
VKQLLSCCRRKSIERIAGSIGKGAPRIPISAEILFRDLAGVDRCRAWATLDARWPGERQQSVCRQTSPRQKYRDGYLSARFRARWLRPPSGPGRREKPPRPVPRAENPRKVRREVCCAISVLRKFAILPRPLYGCGRRTRKNHTHDGGELNFGFSHARPLQH